MPSLARYDGLSSAHALHRLTVIRRFPLHADARHQRLTNGTHHRRSGRDSQHSHDDIITPPTTLLLCFRCSYYRRRFFSRVICIFFGDTYYVIEYAFPFKLAPDENDCTPDFTHDDVSFIASDFLMTSRHRLIHGQLASFLLQP